MTHALAITFFVGAPLLDGSAIDLFAIFVFVLMLSLTIASDDAFDAFAVAVTEAEFGRRALAEKGECWMGRIDMTKVNAAGGLVAVPVRDMGDRVQLASTYKDVDLNPHAARHLANELRRIARLVERRSAPK